MDRTMNPVRTMPDRGLSSLQRSKVTSTKWVFVTTAGILLVLSLIVLGLIAAGASNARDKLYPRYPDVWDWVVPNSVDHHGYLSNHILENGDLLIVYVVAERHARKQSDPELSHVPKKERVLAGDTFFRSKTISKRSVGLGEWAPFSTAKARITLDDGAVLQRYGMLGMRSGGCYDRLNGRVVKKDSSGAVVFDQTLLFVLSEPKHYVTREACFDGADFDYQVDAVFADFIPLEDGTFLLVDHDHGLVVRFDENFRTKSTLMNRRLFWMDTDSLKRFEGKYGDRAEGHRNLGQLQTDLYLNLMEIKRGH